MSSSLLKVNKFIVLLILFPIVGGILIKLGLIPAHTFTLMVLAWLFGIFAYLCIKTRRNITLIALGILFALMLIETFFWVRNEVSQSKNNRKYISQPKFTQPDPVLGSRFMPNIKSDSTLYRGSTLIYKTTYTFDEAGRRVCLPQVSGAKRHALFFGGSLTFGDGVQDSETLASVTQQYLGGEYAAYNYGKGGWGAGQMLTLLRRKNFSQYVPHSEGFAVYVFIGDHIYRTTGKYRYVSYWLDYQIYGYDKNGMLKGPFRWDSDSNIRRWMKKMRFLNRTSSTVKYFTTKDLFHPISNEEAVEVTASVIHAAKAEYQNQFNGNFYVLIWPRLGLSEELNNLFINKLKEKKINIVQVPPYPDKKRSNIHPLDQHPSVEEYQWVAKYLAETINEAAEKRKTQ